MLGLLRRLFDRSLFHLLRRLFDDRLFRLLRRLFDDRLLSLLRGLLDDGLLRLLRRLLDDRLLGLLRRGLGRLGGGSLPRPLANAQLAERAPEDRRQQAAAGVAEQVGEPLALHRLAEGRPGDLLALDEPPEGVTDAAPDRVDGGAHGHVHRELGDLEPDRLQRLLAELRGDHAPEALGDRAPDARARQADQALDGPEGRRLADVREGDRLPRRPLVDGHLGHAAHRADERGKADGGQQTDAGGGQQDNRDRDDDRDDELEDKRDDALPRRLHLAGRFIGLLGDLGADVAQRLVEVLAELRLAGAELLREVAEDTLAAGLEVGPRLAHALDGTGLGRVAGAFVLGRELAEAALPALPLALHRLGEALDDALGLGGRLGGELRQALFGRRGLLRRLLLERPSALGADLLRLGHGLVDLTQRLGEGLLDLGRVRLLETFDLRDRLADRLVHAGDGVVQRLQHVGGRAARRRFDALALLRLTLVDRRLLAILQVRQLREGALEGAVDGLDLLRVQAVGRRQARLLGRVDLPQRAVPLGAEGLRLPLLVLFEAVTELALRPLDRGRGFGGLTLELLRVGLADLSGGLDLGVVFVLLVVAAVEERPDAALLRDRLRRVLRRTRGRELLRFVPLLGTDGAGLRRDLGVGLRDLRLHVDADLRQRRDLGGVRALDLRARRGRVRRDLLLRLRELGVETALRARRRLTRRGLRLGDGLRDGRALGVACRGEPTECLVAALVDQRLNLLPCGRERLLALFGLLLELLDLEPDLPLGRGLGLLEVGGIHGGHTAAGALRGGLHGRRARRLENHAALEVSACLNRRGGRQGLGPSHRQRRLGRRRGPRGRSRRRCRGRRRGRRRRSGRIDLNDGPGAALSALTLSLFLSPALGPCFVGPLSERLALGALGRQQLGPGVGLLVHRGLGRRRLRLTFGGLVRLRGVVRAGDLRGFLVGFALGHRLECRVGLRLRGDGHAFGRRLFGLVVFGGLDPFPTLRGRRRAPPAARTRPGGASLDLVGLALARALVDRGPLLRGARLLILVALLGVGLPKPVLEFRVRHASPLSGSVSKQCVEVVGGRGPALGRRVDGAARVVLNASGLLRAGLGGAGPQALEPRERQPEQIDQLGLRRHRPRRFRRRLERLEGPPRDERDQRLGLRGLRGGRRRARLGVLRERPKGGDCALDLLGRLFERVRVQAEERRQDLGPVRGATLEQRDRGTEPWHEGRERSVRLGADLREHGGADLQSGEPARAGVRLRRLPGGQGRDVDPYGLKGLRIECEDERCALWPCGRGRHEEKAALERLDPQSLGGRLALHSGCEDVRPPEDLSTAPRHSDPRRRPRDAGASETPRCRVKRAPASLPFWYASGSFKPTPALRVTMRGWRLR